MSILLFLCLLLLLKEGNARKTMVIRIDYESQHSGWFHIPIKNNAKVENVMWCSELLPHQPGAVRTDIQDCRARGILKAQVYPGNPDHYAFDHDQKTIRISPESIGGFWMNRQADIVIHGTVNEGKDDFEQIVRINPLANLENGEETKMIDNHVPVEKPVAPIVIIDTGNDKEKGNPGNGVVSPQPTISPSPDYGGEGEEKENRTSNPKLVLFITLGFGLVMMVATVILAVNGRTKQRSTPYSTSSSLQFSSPSVRGLEMDLRLAMEDEEIFVMIDNEKSEHDYQEYLEDQAILNQMTKAK